MAQRRIALSIYRQADPHRSRPMNEDNE